MRSSPEPAPVAVAWLPPDLTGAVAAPRSTAVTSPRVFEFAGGAGVPEQVVAPARTAAANAGYVTGWNVGHQAGLARAAADAAQDRTNAETQTAQAVAQLQAAARALHVATRSLDARQATALAEVEHRIVAGAFDIAESLVGVILRDDARRGAAVVARALAGATTGESATISIGPVDAATVQAVLAERPEVDVVVDASLAPGDAYARFGASSVDARISAGLERVRSLIDGDAAA